MDPDAALRELRGLTREVIEHGRGLPESVERLIELIEGLDGWIVKGGFLPVRWGGLPSDDAINLADTVDRALQPCGLSVVRDGAGKWAVVLRDDAALPEPAGSQRFGAFGVMLPLADRRPMGCYARNLSAPELARWADGWLAAWRVWGAGKG